MTETARISLPARMQAFVLTRYGGPEALELREIERPEPSAGQVLVQVATTSINDWDYCFMRGEPRVYRLLFGLTRPKISVLGTEVAGTVAAVGAGVQTLRVGDRVYGDLSEAGFGAFAEYVCAPERSLTPMPPSMSFEDGAALPHAAGLARQGLVDVGQMREGERVLINGAAGGVGTIGLQLAKQAGAEVTGVDSAEKLPALRAMGFDHVLDYRTQDFTQQGQRYALILDTKTTRAPGAYLRCLRDGGRYVTVGGDPGKILQLLTLGPLLSAFRDARLCLVALKPNKDLALIGELFTAGKLRCTIDGPYPLRDMPQALARFGAAQHVGKIVIRVPG